LLPLFFALNLMELDCFHSCACSEQGY
jgi:hypothetical protein